MLYLLTSECMKESGVAKRFNFEAQAKPEAKPAKKAEELPRFDFDEKDSGAEPGPSELKLKAYFEEHPFLEVPTAENLLKLSIEEVNAKFNELLKEEREYTKLYQFAQDKEVSKDMREMFEARKHVFAISMEEFEEVRRRLGAPESELRYPTVAEERAELEAAKQRLARAVETQPDERTDESETPEQRVA